MQQVSVEKRRRKQKFIGKFIRSLRLIETFKLIEDLLCQKRYQSLTFWFVHQKFTKPSFHRQAYQNYQSLLLVTPVGPCSEYPLTLCINLACWSIFCLQLAPCTVQLLHKSASQQKNNYYSFLKELFKLLHAVNMPYGTYCL